MKGLQTMEVIVSALLKKAAKQDLKAIEMIFDRIEGRPKQATELTGKDGKDLNSNNINITYNGEQIDLKK